MNNLNRLFFLLFITVAFGQDHYKFSKDILTQINKDSVAWKYQTGATELSFSGYYQDVLNTWDKNGLRKPNTTVEDSLYFVNAKKINAKDYIVEQSKYTQIIIINEAHHMAQHRMFTKSLLKDLYDNGYRYLGLEALFDSTINDRKYPIIDSGYYTKEPEFGSLIAEALNLGFTLFSYEAAQGKNGKEREIEQAENIQKFIQSVPEGKVLIHCGYAHAFENDYPAWGKAMAGRLKDLLNSDPLTIDQTMFLEKSDKAFNHLFINLNTAKAPVVLMDSNGQVFNGKSDIKQTDMVILHPQTNYINNRPEWLAQGKETYNIPPSKLQGKTPVLVLAYRSHEPITEAIPADVIELTETTTSPQLFLSKGAYTIVIKDANYQLIEQYPIEIN